MLRMTIEQALEAVAQDEIYARFLAEGCGDVGFYRPRGTDPQQPHLRDEVYIVARGTGIFLCGDVRVEFAPGDALYVPRGAIHHFEDFTDDFATWVIFFGPSPTRQG